MKWAPHPLIFTVISTSTTHWGLGGFFIATWLILQGINKMPCPQW